MLFQSLVPEIEYKMLVDMAAQQRVARINEYTRRYDQLQGDVFKDGRVEEVWPRYLDEKMEEYRERVKIWVPWPSLICERFTSVCLSEKVERKWVDLETGSEPSDEAKRANELNELMNEVNSWDSTAHKVYFEALGIGEMHLWPEFRRCSRESGEPYTVANGQGVPFWSDWFPWFSEQVTLYDHASEPVGAVRIWNTDGQYANVLLNSQIPGGGLVKGVVEIWLAPLFDTRTGVKTFPGYYRKWVNEVPVPVEGEEFWWDRNDYGLNPVVTFKGPDPDESKYRGKSFVDRFANLAITSSRTLSAIGQAIDVLPNLWVAKTSDAKDLKSLSLRHNKVITITGPDPDKLAFEQAARQLNLGEDWNHYNALSKLIGLVAQFPTEILTDIGGSGKLVTGVALQILFQPIVDGLQSIRASFSESEKQRMRVSVAMFNAHNPNSKIDVSKLRPEVTYNNDVIPANDAENIVNDLSLLDKGVIGLRDLVKKYNQNVTTDEQADEFIKRNAQDKRMAQPTVLPQRPGLNRPFMTQPNTGNQ